MSLYQQGAILKYKGQTVANNNYMDIVFQRGPNQEDFIAFTAKPVLSLDEFNELCKEPQPPIITYPEATGKPSEKDLDDVGYTAKLQEYYLNRFHWMFLTSLKDSKDIEWDTVNMLDPSTYKNCVTELEASGFLPAEVNELHKAVQIVNGLDETQMEKARENFLRLKQAQLAS